MRYELIELIEDYNRENGKQVLSIKPIYVDGYGRNKYKIVDIEFEGDDLDDLKQIIKPLVCDVCGSNEVIEHPSMGTNCNYCNPILTEKD